MSDVEMIMDRLRVLGLEETKLVSKAVREHLEELDDVAAYDEAKAQPEEGESLESVVQRFSPPPAS
jgi:hypothetical protein